MKENIFISLLKNITSTEESMQDDNMLKSLLLSGIAKNDKRWGLFPWSTCTAMLCNNNLGLRVKSLSYSLDFITTESCRTGLDKNEIFHPFQATWSTIGKWPIWIKSSLLFPCKEENILAQKNNNLLQGHNERAKAKEECSVLSGKSCMMCVCIKHL